MGLEFNAKVDIENRNKSRGSSINTAIYSIFMKVSWSHMNSRLFLVIFFTVRCTSAKVHVCNLSICFCHDTNDGWIGVTWPFLRTKSIKICVEFNEKTRENLRFFNSCYRLKLKQNKENATNSVWQKPLTWCTSTNI